MNIRIRHGYVDPDSALQVDVRVIVDVFRASTTAIAILEKQPSEFLISNDLEIIRKLAMNSYLVVSEVFDLGIDNSPSLIRKKFLLGEKVVQKTTNLTTAIEKNYFEGPILIGCFNNLGSLVSFIRKQNFEYIEIIPAGLMGKLHPTNEDTHCAELIRARIISNVVQNPDLDLILSHFEEKKRTRGWSEHFIEDLEIAVRLDTSMTVPFVVRKSPGIFSVRSK